MVLSTSRTDCYNEYRKESIVVHVLVNEDSTFIYLPVIASQEATLLIEFQIRSSDRGSTEA